MTSMMTIAIIFLVLGTSQAFAPMSRRFVNRGSTERRKSDKNLPVDFSFDDDFRADTWWYLFSTQEESTVLKGKILIESLDLLLTSTKFKIVVPHYNILIL